MNKKIIFIFLLIPILMVWISTDYAKDIRHNKLPALHKTTARPDVAGEVHNIGTLWNTSTNHGQYGHTDQLTPSMLWPGGSDSHYLWDGRFWVGAILDGEKRVSHYDYGNAEWYPKEGSLFNFGPGKSILDTEVWYDDQFSITDHFTLGLEVHETGLAWSMSEYDDFILYEYEIMNVGDYVLNDVFIAWNFDCDLCAVADPSDPNIDDLVDYEGWDGTDSDNDIVDWVDPLDLDEDGLDGYDEWGWPYAYPLATTAGPTNPNYDVSLIEPDGFYDDWSVFLDNKGPVINWQTDQNWAEKAAGTPAYTMNGDTLRGYLFPRSASFMFDGDYASTPEMDLGERTAAEHNAGFIFGQLLYSDIIFTETFPYATTEEDTFMRPYAHQWWNWESDPGDDIEKYDYMAAEHNASTQVGNHYYFLPNPFDVAAPAFDYRWVTSTGPFNNFKPGDVIRVAYVTGVGLGFKGMRENIDNSIKAYYAGAEWSNPYHPSSFGGDDSRDGQPYLDKHYVLPIPPPVPNLTYSPLDGGVSLAWDKVAETAIDAMLGTTDFEGYKIYRSMYNPSDWEMVAAFDNRADSVFVLNTNGDTLNTKDTNGEWIKEDLPDIVHEYKDIGGTFLGREVSRPINGLKYYYAVVAYDPNKEATALRPFLSSQESSKSNYLTDPNTGAPLEMIPTKLYTESVVDVDMSKIRVVPNPYKGTALFESRYEDKIRFTNLPPSCKISIFTITGDLVDTIYHNDASASEIWDLISRNRQKTVSGLYIYTVETEEPKYKKEIGKFVIIR